MILFLTSCLNLYDKNEKGIRIAHNLGNQNQIQDNFKKYIKKYDNFVFVASQTQSAEITDVYAKATFESFNISLPFKNYIVLDQRNSKNANEIIKNADFIYLCGGHVPTQNLFFNKINLKDIIKKSNAVICGASAGSMNCADVVYSQPELTGEALNKNYKRYLKGLGLTQISILPHWNEKEINQSFLDGFNLTNDIFKPDSLKKPFLAFNDGTYILQTEDKIKIYGKSYIFIDGKFKQISSSGEIKSLDSYIKLLSSYNENL